MIEENIIVTENEGKILKKLCYTIGHSEYKGYGTNQVDIFCSGVIVRVLQGLPQLKTSLNLGAKVLVLPEEEAKQSGYKNCSGFRVEERYYSLLVTSIRHAFADELRSYSAQKRGGIKMNGVPIQNMGKCDNEEINEKKFSVIVNLSVYGDNIAGRDRDFVLLHDLERKIAREISNDEELALYHAYRQSETRPKDIMAEMSWTESHIRTVRMRYEAILERLRIFF